MISVIVPIYNVDQYLERCLNSILRQTYSDLEIILVNDGSTDSSGEICEKYKKMDSRIVVIHKKNGGLSDARNSGIDKASGEYITFVDSDDWIDNDMYEVLLKALIDYEADISECSYRNIYYDYIKEETDNTEEIIIGDRLFALENQLAWKYFRSIVCNKIYKRFIFNNLRFPNGKLHEDEFITYKTFYLANKLVSIDISKYNYVREREGSITEKFKEKNIDKYEAMKEKMDFIFNKSDLMPLRKKMREAYCWVVFDVLYDCYQYKVNSERVEKIKKELKQDYWLLTRSEINWRYKVELSTLMVSYQLFIIFRQIYLWKNKKGNKIK